MYEKSRTTPISHTWSAVDREAPAGAAPGMELLNDSNAALGVISYLATSTRPDLLYAFGALSTVANRAPSPTIPALLEIAKETGCDEARVTGRIQLPPNTR